MYCFVSCRARGEVGFLVTRRSRVLSYSLDRAPYVHAILSGVGVVTGTMHKLHSAQLRGSESESDLIWKLELAVSGYSGTPQASCRHFDSGESVHSLTLTIFSSNS